MHNHIFLTEPSSPNVGKGRLTERLLAQGLLTPHMLQELKKEWQGSADKGSSSQDNNSPLLDKKGKRKRRTK